MKWYETEKVNMKYKIWTLSQPELVIMQPLRFNTALEVEYWMLRPLIWQAEAAQPNRQLEKIF